jgi:hypothetical protein
VVTSASGLHVLGEPLAGVPVRHHGGGCQGTDCTAFFANIDLPLGEVGLEEGITSVDSSAVLIDIVRDNLAEGTSNGLGVVGGNLRRGRGAALGVKPWGDSSGRSSTHEGVGYGLRRRHIAGWVGVVGRDEAG